MLPILLLRGPLQSIQNDTNDNEGDPRSKQSKRKKGKRERTEQMQLHTPVNKRLQLTIKHNRANSKTALHNLADISRLLIELPNCACLRSLLRVHQASGYFDDGSVDGRSPLLLEEDLGCCGGVLWVFEDSDYADAIDV